MQSTSSPYSRDIRSKVARGMTLIEVMIVVVIVGVLTSLAVYGVTRYVRASQSTEAVGVINAIKGAQEVYRQDTFQYLDVSDNDLGASFPTANPAPAAKQAWAGTGAVANKFKMLGVNIDSGVFFVYSCAARPGNGSQIDTPPTTKVTDYGLNTAAAAVEPRYIVMAKGDLDGDETTYSYAVSHNLMSEIYTENDGE